MLQERVVAYFQQTLRNHWHVAEVCCARSLGPSVLGTTDLSLGRTHRCSLGPLEVPSVSFRLFMFHSISTSRALPSPDNPASCPNPRPTPLALICSRWTARLRRILLGALQPSHTHIHTGARRRVRLSLGKGLFYLAGAKLRATFLLPRARARTPRDQPVHDPDVHASQEAKKFYVFFSTFSGCFPSVGHFPRPLTFILS